MAKETEKTAQGINALGAKAAYNLANVTKTKPQYGALTPKWLTKFLEFKGLETGIFRVNKVVEGETPLDVLCSQTKKSDIIPNGYVEYETEPREYRLNSISTIINVNTAIEDVYSAPYDQVQEQLGLAIESLRERQESQLINNDDYGLLKNIADSQRIQTRTGAPTPDDMDELIPNKFEAGTGSIADAVGLGAALQYLTEIGMPCVYRWEHELLQYAMKEMKTVKK